MPRDFLSNTCCLNYTIVSYIDIGMAKDCEASMAFKTASRNQQRWTSNPLKLYKSGGGKKKSKILDLNVLRARAKKAKKKINAVKRAVNIAKKKKETNWLIQQYANAVLCHLAYDESIPSPPQTLFKRVAVFGPEKWAMSFYNWENAFKYYRQQRGQNVALVDVQTFNIKLLTPKQYKDKINSFKCNIVQAVLGEKSMPRIPEMLKESVGDMDLWEWLKTEDDFDKFERYLQKCQRKYGQKN